LLAALYSQINERLRSGNEIALATDQLVVGAVIGFPCVVDLITNPFQILNKANELAIEIAAFLAISRAFLFWCS